MEGERVIYCATTVNTVCCLRISAGRHFIYEELKVIFQKNKQGFDSQSRTLTHFVAFEDHMADNCLAKPSQSLLQLAILGVCVT